ncbi:MAG: calcium/proton exchanger [Candidatus Moranbacteria bacterium]|nr:calcium/proton exchanger [Candidatus Moranbacteria bacterium]
MKNNKTKMLNKIFAGMLIFLPVAVAAHFLNFSPILVFSLSALAIVPLAKFIGEATEELSVYTGSALGGFLNASFGNATEFIIGIFALRAGLIEVVKASITGAIVGNLLLVLGAAIFVGGLKFKKQKFNKTAAMTSGATLLLAVIALVMPAIFHQTSPEASTKITQELSVFVSIFMLIVYLASLLFILFTHKHLYTEEVGKLEAKWSKMKSIIILLVATIAVAWMSEILVGSIEPIVKSLGWTELFIGVIFVAIIGNAAEHTSAITMALKNKMDLALQISIGSATQIAMFVAPVLVLISLFFREPMSLIFNIFELVAIVLSVLIANLITEDGESNWFEGLQLLMAYAIMGVAFFFHP